MFNERFSSEIEAIELAYSLAEQPVSGAPVFFLNDSQACVPQHFISYDHSYESVVQIVSDIKFDNRYPIFVGYEDSAITIQVGIIGYDNYKKQDEYNEQHIVYGRKWRVERNLPSSEIIQTAFLALMKAREHEVRELFRIHDDATLKQSTPLSGHLDTPLIVKTIEMEEPILGLSVDELLERVQQTLSFLKFDGQEFIIREFHRIGFDRLLVDIHLIHTCDSSSRNSLYPEWNDLSFTLVLQEWSESRFIFDLFEQILSLSNSFVAENFTYRGYKRFSKYLNLKQTGALSIVTRDKRFLNNSIFQKEISTLNSKVDATRVPVLDPKFIGSDSFAFEFDLLSGHKPIISI